MYVYDEKNNTWVALRSTQEYKKKRKIARDYWIIALLAMSLLPLGAIIFLIFLMTFLTFTFLDESIYHFNREES